MLDQLAEADVQLNDELSASYIYEEFIKLHKKLYPLPTPFQKAKLDHIDKQYNEIIRKKPKGTDL